MKYVRRENQSEDFLFNFKIWKILLGWSTHSVITKSLFSPPFPEIFSVWKPWKVSCRLQKAEEWRWRLSSLEIFQPPSWEMFSFNLVHFLSHKKQWRSGHKQMEPRTFPEITQCITDFLLNFFYRFSFFCTLYLSSIHIVRVTYSMIQIWEALKRCANNCQRFNWILIKCGSNQKFCNRSIQC